MIHPQKQLHDGKWKALRNAAVAELDQLVKQFIAADPQPDWVGYLVKMQMILIDLMDALVEPEEPE